MRGRQSEGGIKRGKEGERGDSGEGRGRVCVCVREREGLGGYV